MTATTINPLPIAHDALRSVETLANLRRHADSLITAIDAMTQNIEEGGPWAGTFTEEEIMEGAPLGFESAKRFLVEECLYTSRAAIEMVCPHTFDP
jgi:hypothetical protein